MWGYRPALWVGIPGVAVTAFGLLGPLSASLDADRSLLISAKGAWLAAAVRPAAAREIARTWCCERTESRAVLFRRSMLGVMVSSARPRSENITRGEELGNLTPDLAGCSETTDIDWGLAAVTWRPHVTACDVGGTVCDQKH